MFLTMGISLYSTRIVLNALGNTDFGIFNLIAGVVTMLSFLKAAMSTSTQRFLSFFQGKNDLKMQKSVFTNSMLLHIVIGILILLILEGIGPILFNGFLNVPSDRIETAKDIYRYMGVTVFFTILAVPFTGSLIAHENMSFIAVVTIIEVILKLLIAILLVYTTSDKLQVYGILTAAVSMVSFLFYAVFCCKKYVECSFRNLFRVDKKLTKELTSFAGWNLFGSICGLSKTQGIAVLLNLFFGAVINAAYAIANQVSAQINFFSITLLRAIEPQIMKSEGADNRKRMLRLSMIASKFGFFLLALFAIPCIFEINSILELWLGVVPPYTSVFCSIILIGILVNQLTVGLQSAIQASGNIVAYQAVVGGVQLLNLPLAYFLLKCEQPAYTALLSFVFIEIVACILRLWFLKKKTGLSIGEYCSKVFIKAIVPLIVIVVACGLIVQNFHFPYRFIITSIVSSIAFLISIYFFGLCSDEKGVILDLKVKVVKRVKNFRS